MRRWAIPWLALGLIGSSAWLVTCGGGSDTETSTGTQCPNGICGTTTKTETGTGGAGTTSTTGTTGTGGTAGCIESWLCTPWQTDGTSDNGTRVCTDKNSCGTTSQKPTESTTLPALDFDYYKCKVEPIFDRGCAQLGCHGTEQGRALRIYARGRLRITGEILIEPGCLNPGKMVPSENCIGSIECACFSVPHTDTEWRRNYDGARSFMLDPQGAPIPAAMVDTSELIAQPVVGGKAHANVHLFSKGDADYQTLTAWLTGAKLGSTCNTNN
jgi:hypothetical protein